MSLELLLHSTLAKKNDKRKHPSDHSSALLEVSTAVVILFLALFIWALIRAYKCSNRDNSVTHFLFATMSPTTYLLLSYFVPGFCKKQ